MNTLIHCKVTNHWMWGVENANLTITSPSGGYVQLKKMYMSKKFSDELRSLIWRIEGNGESIRLTKDEMLLLTTYPNAVVYKPKKVNMNTLVQIKQNKMVVKKKVASVGDIILVKKNSNSHNYDIGRKYYVTDVKPNESGVMYQAEDPVTGWRGNYLRSSDTELCVALTSGYSPEFFM